MTTKKVTKELTDEQMEQKLMAGLEVKRQTCLQELDQVITTCMQKHGMILDVSFILNPRTGMQPHFNVIPAPRQQ